MATLLGDICTFQSGGTPSKRIPEYFGGTIPWISTVALNGKRVGNEEAVAWITEKAILESSARVIPPNSIMVGVRVGVGKVAINSVPLSTNQDIVSLLDIDESLWDKEFICKFIQSKNAYLNGQSRGATIKGIKTETLSELQLPSISIDDQHVIVHILNSAISVIEENRKRLAYLNNLIKARFVEMFGDSNNSKDYPIVKVQDVAEIQVGVVIKPAQYYTDAEHGVKAFRSLNIGEITIKDEEWVYFNDEGQKKNSKSILKENDLVIVRSGAPGTACVVTKQFEGSNAVDVIIAHPDMRKVNPYYLCAFTNYPHGKRQIEAGTGGAAQQHFNVGKYKEMDLIYPPKEEQDQFVSFVKQVDKSKVVVQKALDKAQQLFDSLMQEYFG